VLVNHYMNAWSLLPWFARDAEKGTSAAASDTRKIIPVAGIDPYAWKGYEQPPADCHMRTCKANREEMEKRKAQLAAAAGKK